MTTRSTRPARRSIASMAAFLLAACAGAAQAASFTMYRDPNCGCCLSWADHMEQGGKHEVETIDHPDMRAVKTQRGVPGDLRSCHTVIADGYVIEGHVPAADVERLLAERPEGVTGLAVAGMPMGSPGMEHGDHRQPYQVIAFGPAGRSVWASYPGNAS
ncbi:MAG: metal-binding protein [Croceicoccus sp.]|nr:metal-binding protein [Croceicoccus sp.]MAL25132.1 metal-binding protein [Croceicoccus sp.]